jgi:hypothetical protein
MGNNQEKISSSMSLSNKAPENFHVPAYPQGIQERIEQRKQERERAAELERRNARIKPRKPDEKKKKWVPPTIPYRKEPSYSLVKTCEELKSYKGCKEAVLAYFIKFRLAFDRCYVSQETIAASVKYSISQVKRVLKELSNDGFISYDQAMDKITCDYTLSPIFNLQEVQNHLYKKYEGLTYKFMALFKPIIISLLFGASYKAYSEDRGPYVEIPIALKRIVYPSQACQMSDNSKCIFIKKLTCSTPPSTERGLGAREGAPTSLVGDLLAKFTASSYAKASADRPKKPTTTSTDAPSLVVVHPHKETERPLISTRFGIQSVSDPQAYMDSMSDILSQLSTRMAQNSTPKDENRG